MTSPMPEPELRMLAKSNQSVNVDLASYFELRWHDPHYVEVWQRWSKARSDWKRVGLEYTTRWRWEDGMARLLPQETGPGGFYDPNPSSIQDSDVAAVAREYVESRKLYKATLDHYMKGSES